MSDEPEKTNQKQEKGGLFQKGGKGGPGHPKGVPNMKARFLKNLERFSKMPLPHALKSRMRSQFPGLPADMNIEDAEAVVVHAKALQGESWAFDRLHDRPGQKLDVDMETTDKTPEKVFRFVVVTREDVECEEREIQDRQAAKAKGKKQ